MISNEVQLRRVLQLFVRPDLQQRSIRFRTHAIRIRTVHFAFS